MRFKNSVETLFCLVMVKDVKKVILSLLVMIALLSAPIAHAAGLDCKDDNCSKMSKQDNSKASKDKANDDCCTHNVSYFSTQTTKTFIVSSIQATLIVDDAKISSVIAGPPLKPPSHV